MTIHTVAPDEPQFIRVIGSFDMSDMSRVHIGKVGKVVSHTDLKERHEMVFVELNGSVRVSVFPAKDVDFITEKEYFIGCLGG